MKALALAGLLLLPACSSTNLAEVVTAMGKDPASVCVTVTTVYGVAKVYRTAITNGTVVCDQNGMTVTPTKP